MLDGIDLPPEVTWSVAVGAPDGPILLDRTSDVVCATASIGKMLLLLTVAQGIADGAVRADQQVSRLSARPVSDSGIWQHLRVDELPVADVCALVGAVSDNLATNVLIELVGLDAVSATAGVLGLARTGLHDVVRDLRTSEHPPALSTGTARELRGLCDELASPTVIDPHAAQLVTQWLALNTDLSMVAGAFGLDPLAHAAEDRGVELWNKTGTNTGVRCDVGAVSYRSRRLSWAVLANWRVTDERDQTRELVLAAMRGIGVAMRRELEGASSCR